jgi:hypothetical protein
MNPAIALKYAALASDEVFAWPKQALHCRRGPVNKI